MKYLIKMTLLWSLLIAGAMFSGCDASTGTATTDKIKPETVVAESRTGIVMYKSREAAAQVPMLCSASPHP